MNFQVKRLKSNLHLGVLEVKKIHDKITPWCAWGNFNINAIYNSTPDLPECQKEGKLHLGVLEVKIFHDKITSRCAWGKFNINAIYISFLVGISFENTLNLKDIWFRGLFRTAIPPPLALPSAFCQVRGGVTNMCFIPLGVFDFFA